MERKEELKQKLNELNFEFLCLNKDDAVFKSITERFKGKGKLCEGIVRKKGAHMVSGTICVYLGSVKEIKLRQPLAF